MSKRVKTTKRPTKKELPEQWYLVDASDKILGRLAAKITKVLTGKTAATFDPAVANNIKIVVVNANGIKFTGKKLAQKIYYHHSGYMGGLKKKTLSALLEKNPPEVLYKAVSGMLPKNSLRRLRLDNLKIYAGAEHQHIAQKPIKLDL